MPRSASVNLMLGQAGHEGGPGEVLDVEAVPGDVGVLHPVDGPITHANHLVSRAAARDTFADRAARRTSGARRIRRLLDRAATHRARTISPRPWPTT